MGIVRYIIITEDGGIYKADKITQDEKNAVSDGILDVIDVRSMIQLGPDDEWAFIEAWKG